jgi:hypothetical protein
MLYAQQSITIAYQEQHRYEHLSRRPEVLAEGDLVQRVWKKIRT